MKKGHQLKADQVWSQPEKSQISERGEWQIVFHLVKIWENFCYDILFIILKKSCKFEEEMLKIIIKQGH